MKKVFFMITALGLVYLIVSSINTDLFSLRATQTVTEQRDMNPHEKSSNGETDKFASAAFVDNKELDNKELDNKELEANDQGEQAQAHKLSDLRRSDLGFGESGLAQSGLSESENTNQALELEFNKLSKAHASLQEEFALLRASLSKIQATTQDTAHVNIAENNHSLGSQQTSMQHSSSYPSNSHPSNSQPSNSQPSNSQPSNSQPSNSQPSAAATVEQAQEGLKTTSYDSEQKRRLQQQAVLRDLAQKRQLAAIQALQTSSAR